MGKTKQTKEIHEEVKAKGKNLKRVPNQSEGSEDESLSSESEEEIVERKSKKIEKSKRNGLPRVKSEVKCQNSLATPKSAGKSMREKIQEAIDEEKRNANRQKYSEEQDQSYESQVENNSDENSLDVSEDSIDEEDELEEQEDEEDLAYSTKQQPKAQEQLGEKKPNYEFTRKVEFNYQVLKSGKSRLTLGPKISCQMSQTCPDSKEGGEMIKQLVLIREMLQRIENHMSKKSKGKRKKNREQKQENSNVKLEQKPQSESRQMSSIAQSKREEEKPDERSKSRRRRPQREREETKRIVVE